MGAVAAAPVVLGAVGFTSAGIAAGSMAANMMSAAAVWWLFFRVLGLLGLER